MNEDRKCCHLRAKFLRQENLPVPMHCDRHEPACLMQHAALTTLEAFLIQFFVFRKAKGLDLLASPPRPRWHPYSTFEYQLPLTFCGTESAVINPAGQDICSKQAMRDDKSKPELQCHFCSGIKAYKSVIALWSHFVHQHARSSEGSSWYRDQRVVSEDLLLQEICRTAKEWRLYWKHSDGGKRRDPTMLKLIQVEEDGFAWKDVLDWQLR